jgi:O-antigen/teichoic acid export membrane protein
MKLGPGHEYAGAFMQFGSSARQVSRRFSMSSLMSPAVTRLLAVISRYGALAAQFLIVVTVARALPKTDSGTYLLIFSAVTTTIVFVGFGAPDGLVKAVPELMQRGRYGAIRGQVARTASVTGLLGGLFLSGLCLAAYCLGYESWLIGAFAAWWVPYATLFFCGQALVALGRTALGTFLFYTLNNVATISLLVPYLLFSEHPTAASTLHVSIAAGWFAALSGVAALIKAVSNIHQGAPDPTRVHGTLRLGFVIALSRMFQGALYWVPAWVAAAVLGAADAAVISAAGRLLIAATAVIAVFRFTIRPRIVAAEARGDRRAVEDMSRFAATVSLAFVLLCIVIVLAVGRSAVTLVFGPSFSQAAEILSILLLGGIGESFAGPVDEVLKYSGHALLVLASLVVTVFLELGIAWTLATSLHSLSAVALAQSIAFCGMYAAQILICKRKLGVLIVPFISLAGFRSAFRSDGAILRQDIK